MNANVSTTTVTSVQTGSILADALGVTLSADFEIDPANQVDLISISVSPGSILGGRNLSGTVNLTDRAPGGGINVQVASDSNSVHPPAVVNVPFNQSSATFTIGTVAVASEVNATLTATLGRTSVTAPVKLLPPANALARFGGRDRRHFRERQGDARRPGASRRGDSS